MIPVFLLTYNEADLFLHYYTDEFVNEHFKPNDIVFHVLDNGNQPRMRAWCERHGYVYYGSEYNIGSAAGYNWIFKLAYMRGFAHAILMQADVEMNNAGPLIRTYELLLAHGEEYFVCWPQELWGHWLEDPSQVRPLGHVGDRDELHNLGNLVGFCPQIMQQKNCYFDENYVVTHYDDVEFIQWIYANGSMKAMNAALTFENQQYYTRDEQGYPVRLEKTFNIQCETFHMKIHHASITIEYQQRGTKDSHEPWREFNKPYYDLISKRRFSRLGYDHTRWTQFGYPKYPVEHELRRFTAQYPELIVHPEMGEVLDKDIPVIGS